MFLVLILQSACFIYITWKRKQTMEQQQDRACEWTKSNQNRKTKITSYSNHSHKKRKDYSISSVLFFSFRSILSMSYDYVQIDHAFYCSI